MESVIEMDFDLRCCQGIRIVEWDVETVEADFPLVVSGQLLLYVFG